MSAASGAVPPPCSSCWEPKIRVGDLWLCPVCPVVTGPALSNPGADWASRRARCAAQGGHHYHGNTDADATCCVCDGNPCQERDGTSRQMLRSEQVTTPDRKGSSGADGG